MKNDICPSCEAELPVNAPHGLCPTCVLRGAHESEFLADVPSLAQIQAAFPELKILECIGRGGMGIVYKAEQPALDRYLALKILDPSLSGDPGFAERFEREARTLGKLAHPNIVAIHEFGERGGFFWLTMELVEGVNLRQAMQTAMFTPNQALEVIPELCSALQFAHEKGVLHRDIKPENILIDTRGHIKIADFGIARLMGEQADFTLTHTGSALGSTAYMAPEQIESPHDVDHRADIYSLGVVFYEMLTGSLPLGRFPAPSEKSTSDPSLDKVVFRALAKERESRYQSAGEVNEGVKTAHQSVAPSERSPAESAQTLEKRSLLSWIGGIVGAVIGFYTSPLLCGLGITAAVFGLVGCWVTLWRIKTGSYRSEHHHALLFITFWPVVIAIASYSLILYLMLVDPTRLKGITLLVWQPFLFFLALLVPSLVGVALWKWVGTGTQVLKSRLWLFAACVLVSLSALAAKISYLGTGNLRGTLVQGIQFAAPPQDLEGQEKIKAAMIEAAGPFADYYRVRYLTQPRDLGKAKRFYAEVEISASSEKVAHQHWQNFTSRLRSLLPTTLRQSGSYRPKDEEIDDLIQHYRLWTLPLLILVPVTVIVSILLSGKKTAVLLFLAAVVTIAASQLTWWPHSRILPPSVGMAPPPPVFPPMEYDFSTTRDAMESTIKAAKKNDREGFLRGLTSAYRKALLKDEPELSDMMKGMAMVKYGGQKMQQGEHASVKLIYPDGHGFIDLVKVNREWKLPLPEEPEFNYSVPLATIHSMVKAAKANDYYAFERGMEGAIFDKLTKEPALLEALKEQFKSLTEIKQIESGSGSPRTALVAAKDGDRELLISMVLRDAVHVFFSGTPEQKTVTIKEWHITKIE
ncbi:MAG: protein kinase domain-containing protein [Roseibacillus sp.]